MNYSIRNDKLRLGNTNVRFVQSSHAGNQIVPVFLVMHYTASSPTADIAQYFKNNNRSVSAHLVVRRDGSISQCVPFDRKANHAGSSRWRKLNGELLTSLNSHTIGIELENWGPLSRTGGVWRSYTGALVDSDSVVVATHRNESAERGWEVFPERQMEAALGASRAIVEHYNIEQIVGHDDIAPSRKIDPGPAFTMGQFKEQVFGENDGGDDTMRVRSASGLNLRTGPGTQYDIKTELADGTVVLVHQSVGNWRFVSPLDGGGVPMTSGYVHGAFLSPT